MPFGRKLKLTAAQLSHAQRLIEHGDRATVTRSVTVARSTLYRALQREAA